MNIRSKLASSVMTLAFVSISALSVSAQQFASRSTRATTLPPTSTISTLYTNDPIANTLCFADGNEGGVFQDGEARNRCSHIEFDRYKAGNLSVGIEGGESGTILDLGTSGDLHTNNQAFPGIHFIDGKVLLLITIQRKETRQELTQAAQIFQDSKGIASVEAKSGHIYLARITDRYKKDFQILVKLLVLTARPGESVTFRWELL